MNVISSERLRVMEVSLYLFWFWFFLRVFSCSQSQVLRKWWIKHFTLVPSNGSFAYNLCNAHSFSRNRHSAEILSSSDPNQESSGQTASGQTPKEDSSGQNASCSSQARDDASATPRDVASCLPREGTPGTQASGQLVRHGSQRHRRSGSDFALVHLPAA